MARYFTGGFAYQNIFTRGKAVTVGEVVVELERGEEDEGLREAVGGRWEWIKRRRDGRKGGGGRGRREGRMDR